MTVCPAIGKMGGRSERAPVPREPAAQRGTVTSRQPRWPREPRVSRWLPRIFAGCFASIVVVACGSATSTSPARSMATPTSTKTRALADLMVAALVDANASHSLHYSQTQASCLVSRVIAGIGEPRLVELSASSGDDLSVLRWTASERAREIGRAHV